MVEEKETIAAIATALSASGIGIVRISGPEAIDIVNRIYRTKNGCQNLKDFGSHTIHYGFIWDGKEELDKVMVAVMKKPNSYTREDTVEINCHGGILIMQKILDTVIKNGARAAQPGEFTKRAFLNGRIDLAEAEAVMDLIQSENEYALKASVSQLKGSVSRIVSDMREAILYEIAFIESALDDPEHISTEGYREKLLSKIHFLTDQLRKLIDSSKNGKLIKEGINTVIVGKPNAGKSSLLNLLLGEDRAIVTDIAGTTRDILTESISLHGIGLNIIDTAGIRDTEDIIEKIGVEKARKYAAEADLILYVVDTSVPLDESDDDILKIISDKRFIILLNKTDLTAEVTPEMMERRIGSGAEFRMIKTSAKENIGMEEFEEAVKEMFFQGEISINSETVITNVRHKEALQDAFKGLKMVEDSLMKGMPEDFYSIDLMDAYTSLGLIIGEEVEDDLMNEIFNHFCMGK